MRDQIADMLFHLRRYLAKRGFVAFFALLLGYFVLSGVHGDRGLYAWMDITRELEERRLALANLVGERERLERQVAGLKPGQASRDAIEEQLYLLGFVRPNEVVIFKSDLDRAAVAGNSGD